MGDTGIGGIGGDPGFTRQAAPIDTAVWHWLVCNGPHGERFAWHREHGRRDIDLLIGFIEDRESGSPGFAEKARAIALEALINEDLILVLTGIQVLAAIGQDGDLHQVLPLLNHGDTRVRSHARSALFERGIKVKR